MGNSISSINHNMPQNLSRFLFDKTIEENNINSKGVDFTKKLPTEVVERIIIKYAEQIALEFNMKYDLEFIDKDGELSDIEIHKLNNIYFNHLIKNAFNYLASIFLVCKDLNKICNNLNKPNNIFGQLIRYIYSYTSWIKIKSACDNLDLFIKDKEYFLKKIDGIIIRSRYVKIIFPYITVREWKNKAYQALSDGCRWLTYFDLNVDNPNKVDLEDYWYYLISSLKFHNFYFNSFNLDLSQAKIKKDDLMYLLSALQDKIFGKIIFNSSLDKKVINELNRYFLSPTLSEEEGKMVMRTKNQILQGVRERIEERDKIDIAWAGRMWG